jgi:hypothetical protein
MIPTEASADTDKVVIYASKNKLFFTGLGAVIFVALGAWMLVTDTSSSNTLLKSPTVKYVTGAACILFFGAGGFFIFKKMGDKRPGLIIDRNGITDNSSAVAAKFIPWQDITGIVDYKIAGQKFIVLTVRNPDDYFNHHKGIKRRLAISNYRMTGSPVNIAANGLQIKLPELKELIQRHYTRYHSRLA